MKNLIYLILICFLYTTLSFSQTLTVKYYEAFIISEEKLKELPEEIRKKRTRKNYYDLTVDVNNGISYYVNDDNTKITSYTEENEPKHEVYVDIKNTEKYYYKDLGENDI